MGLLEILLEKSNPGKIGKMSSRGPRRPRPNGWLVLLKCIVCIVVLGGVFIYAIVPTISSSSVAFFVIGIIIYSLIGYHLVPEPDYSNVGWMGGLMDNPFRFSDDINRFLIFLQVFLYPGKFMANTAVDLVRFIFEIKK